MSSDYMEMLKAAAERAKQAPLGLSAEAAIAETRIEGALFAEFGSHDRLQACLAAFRIEALLGSGRRSEFTADDLAAMRDALTARVRSEEAPVFPADIAIASLAGFAEEEKRGVVRILFDRLRGKADFELIAYSNHLVPVIGVGYLYDFEHSTAMGESDGMGGPMRYYLRDFALERLAAHLGFPLKRIGCFDGQAFYYAWSEVPRRQG